MDVVPKVINRFAVQSVFANLVDNDIDQKSCSLGFFGYGFGNALPSDVSGLDILLSDSAVSAEWSHGSNLKQSGIETDNRVIAVNLKTVGVRRIRRGVRR